MPGRPPETHAITAVERAVLEKIKLLGSDSAPLELAHLRPTAPSIGQVLRASTEFKNNNQEVQKTLSRLDNLDLISHDPVKATYTITQKGQQVLDQGAESIPVAVHGTRDYRGPRIGSSS
ncbi:MAG: hypothetical protein AAF988_06570 [Pseudomonadota bacterium]